MKKVILLIVVISVTAITGLRSNISPTMFESVQQENNKIDLSGNFPTTGTRKSFSDISAFKYTDYIEVNLSRVLGEITIKIYDESNNIVYEDIINTSTQSNLLINTAFLETGIYTIEFTNSHGQYMRGDFVI